jgi:hypothetical protein
MKVIESITSADGVLNLQVQEANDGSIVIGFIGSDWHTHPDLIASWLGVPESVAIQTFLSQLTNDKLPIIVSIDGGVTVEPWVSDDHEASVICYGKENCVVRFWSAATANPSFNRDTLKRAR